MKPPRHLGPDHDLDPGTRVVVSIPSWLVTAPKTKDEANNQQPTDRRQVIELENSPNGASVLRIRILRSMKCNAY